MLIAKHRDVSCQYHLKQTMAKSLIPKLFFGVISTSSCDADKVGRIFFDGGLVMFPVMPNTGMALRLLLFR